MLPKNNEIYRHFKGNLYRVITLAAHSETGEQMVVYQALYGECQVYCRPLDMFVEEVDRAKYPDAMQKYRFEPAEGMVNYDSGVSGNATVLVNENNDNLEEKTTKNDAEISEEIPGVDPLVLEFLDADTVSEKRNILTALHHRITDEIINTLAVAMDVVVEDGDIEDRYQQLRSCLATIERYEIERKI